jgi:general nucleoside transport system ATP-binding protein
MSNEPQSPAFEPPAIELRGIDKRFGAVHANKSVSLTVPRGTIHGIVGENGAGKSTLMSILYGFYHADSGEILVAGKPRSIRTPSDAIAAGIGMVHQHFMLVEPFSVLENVVLGAEGGARLGKGVAAARASLNELGKTYAMTVPLDTPISELAVGVQQRVEILKALYRGAEILILDEPTGVLTPAEADHLFAVLGQLRGQGKTVIFITHKLREIMAITDNVSVMRRGEIVGTVATKDTTPQQLAEMMVGRNVRLKVDKAARVPGAVVLQVEGLSALDNRGTQRLRDVSFDIHEGEIVGIAGVAGNGQSELLEVLSGIRRRAGGEILLNGKPLDPTNTDPAKLRHAHVAHVPEDRHRMGLVMPFAATENCILGYQDDPRYTTCGLLDRTAILNDTKQNMADFDCRPADPNLRAANFSGGNQQKLVLSCEFERDPQLLIIGQPTRGVDIGAIEFIHKRLIAMRDAGKAILLVSVELDEIRALADRILVMFDGRIVGTRGPEASENELGLLMAGIEDGQPHARAEAEVVV